MVQAVRINVPLVDVLAGIPNGKFLKELVSNKHKLEQISSAFLSNQSSAVIQNKVPPKLEESLSFLIPCTFSKTFSCNALADLGASINLMPYSLYAKLSLETLKPTKMSVQLADDHSNTLLELLKICWETFSPYHRCSNSSIIKQINLEVGTERMNFSIDSTMKHSYTCFSIDVIDEILEEDSDALLDEGSKILYSIEGTILEDKLFAEFDKFMAMNIEENSEYDSDEEEPLIGKTTFNTVYKIKTSLKEPPSDHELKPLPDHLEYVFLKEPTFLPVIISSQLSKQNKNKLIFVLKRH
ncbi:reverse transcriptase domain-containing protein [Tanacetum coccineum]